MPVSAAAQARPQRDTVLVARRDSLEKELENVAVIDRKLMVPMRDGAKMQFDVYRPKNATGKVPAIFVRTPYNMNFWDVTLGAPADMTAQLDAVKRGYAYVGANERGHFFSEGNYDILGPPLTDGTDEIQWISSQDWSNGKVGLIGCSSTAEWQMAVAAQSPKGLGDDHSAGLRRRRRSREAVLRAGQLVSRRRGADAVHRLADAASRIRCGRCSRRTRRRRISFARRSRSISRSTRRRSTGRRAFWHLPEKDLIKAVGGPRGIFADSMPGIATGGAMIQRAPNDPAWYRGGLFNDDMKINVPGLWFMSWYDVSVGPNLATYNHVRQHGGSGDRESAVRGDRADAALLVQARDGEHDRRRAERRRRASRLRRAHVRLVRLLPQGREERPARYAAEDPLLHDGDEQVADDGHVAAAGARGD